MHNVGCVYVVAMVVGSEVIQEFLDTHRYCFYNNNSHI